MNQNSQNIVLIITQEPLDLHKFQCYFGVPWAIYYNWHTIFKKVLIILRQSSKHAINVPQAYGRFRVLMSNVTNFSTNLDFRQFQWGISVRYVAYSGGGTPLLFVSKDSVKILVWLNYLFLRVYYTPNQNKHVVCALSQNYRHFWKIIHLIL